MLTEEEARDLLARYVPLDQGWGAHSLVVARTAATLADALLAARVPVDPTLARVGGTLHDIGRSVTHDSAGHAWAGHELLTAREEPTLARFCLTHGFGGLAGPEAVLVGWPTGDYRPRTWEERVVAIADGLTHGDRVIVLADRLGSVLERYRETAPPEQYALLLQIEPKMRRLMAEVEAVIGTPVEILCGAERL